MYEGAVGGGQFLYLEIPRLVEKKEDESKGTTENQDSEIKCGINRNNFRTGGGLSQRVVRVGGRDSGPQCCLKEE